MQWPQTDSSFVLIFFKRLHKEFCARDKTIVEVWVEGVIIPGSEFFLGEEGAPNLSHVPIGVCYGNALLNFA